MQPLAVGEKNYQSRIRRTALSIYRQQPRIRYNSTMEIGKVHDERKCQSQRQSTTPGGIEPTNAGSVKWQSHKRNGAAGAVWLRYEKIKCGGESKKKVSRLADRLFGNEACLVSVNHSVVSVTDLFCCDARCFVFVEGFNVNCYALTVESNYFHLIFF